MTKKLNCQISKAYNRGTSCHPPGGIGQLGEQVSSGAEQHDRKHWRQETDTEIDRSRKKLKLFA